MGGHHRYMAPQRKALATKHSTTDRIRVPCPPKRRRPIVVSSGREDPAMCLLEHNAKEASFSSSTAAFQIDIGSTRKLIEQIRNGIVIHPTSDSLIQRISRSGVARTGWLRRPLATVEASFLLAIGRSRATPSFRATSTFRLEARSQPSLQLPSSLSLPLINLLSPPSSSQLELFLPFFFHWMN